MVHSNQQSNSKIATLDIFNSSRRKSSRSRLDVNPGKQDEQPTMAECPTAKRYLHIKEKASVAGEADEYGNKQLAGIVQQLKTYLQAKDEWIRELEIENGELRVQAGMSKK